MASPRVNNGRRRALPYVAAQAEVLAPVRITAEFTEGTSLLRINFLGDVLEQRPWQAGDVTIFPPDGISVSVFNFDQWLSSTQAQFDLSFSAPLDLSYNFGLEIPRPSAWVRMGSGAFIVPDILAVDLAGP